MASTGVAGFLHKPYDPQQLGTQVKQLLEGANASMPAMTAPDPEIAAVQAVFRQRLPARLEALAAALREAQACSGSGEALEAAHRIAHTLKGTVGSYGFDNLAAMLEAIEARLKAARDGKITGIDIDWTQMRDRIDQARADLHFDVPRD